MEKINVNEYVVEEKTIDSKTIEQRRKKYFERLNKIREKEGDEGNGKV